MIILSNKRFNRVRRVSISSTVNAFDDSDIPISILLQKRDNQHERRVDLSLEINRFKQKFIYQLSVLDYNSSENILTMKIGE